ncbi:hypothetical protein L9F63_009030, partial [Diploptera punctata]
SQDSFGLTYLLIADVSCVKIITNMEIKVLYYIFFLPNDIGFLFYISAYLFVIIFLLKRKFSHSVNEADFLLSIPSFSIEFSLSFCKKDFRYECWMDTILVSAAVEKWGAYPEIQITFSLWISYFSFKFVIFFISFSSINCFVLL